MSQIENISLKNAYWSDEFDYEGVAQVRMRSVTGALLVFEQAQPSGQPMTLEGAWVTRSVLDQLHALRQQVNAQFSIRLDDNRTFMAIFNRESKSIEARQLSGSHTAPDGTALYALTLRLLLV